MFLCECVFVSVSLSVRVGVGRGVQSYVFLYKINLYIFIISSSHCQPIAGQNSFTISFTTVWLCSFLSCLISKSLFLISPSFWCFPTAFAIYWASVSQTFATSVIFSSCYVPGPHPFLSFNLFYDTSRSILWSNVDLFLSLNIYCYQFSYHWSLCIYFFSISFVSFSTVRRCSRYNFAVNNVLNILKILS